MKTQLLKMKIGETIKVQTKVTAKLEHMMAGYEEIGKLAKMGYDRAKASEFKDIKKVAELAKQIKEVCNRLL